MKKVALTVAVLALGLAACGGRSDESKQVNGVGGPRTAEPGTVKQR